VRSIALSGVALLSLAFGVAAGCGGGSGSGSGSEVPPAKMEGPVEQTRPPVNGKTAAAMGDVQPADMARATSEPVDAKKGTPAAPAAIELKPMDPPASPAALPKVTILSPKADEAIPADKAAAYEVKLEVKDWPTAKEGPHVHLILDDKPYKAIYEPKATVKLSEIVEGDPTLKEGQHVLVAFPSREGHVSVKPDKGKSPAAVVSFWVGKKGKPDWKPTDPTLIYSRPKGENSGPMADPLMVDFYLLNAELGDKKNAVRVTITPPSGEPKSTTMTSWTPLNVTGLPSGEVKVKLELLDKDGKAVPGPFNTVERTATVTR
jgi:hypothetical protein